MRSFQHPSGIPYWIENTTLNHRNLEQKEQSETPHFLIWAYVTPTVWERQENVMQITGSSEVIPGICGQLISDKLPRTPCMRRRASSTACVGKTRYSHRRVKPTYKTQLKVDPGVKTHDLKLQNFWRKTQRGMFWTWVWTKVQTAGGEVGRLADKTLKFPQNTVSTQQQECDPPKARRHCKAPICTQSMVSTQKLQSTQTTQYPKSNNKPI